MTSYHVLTPENDPIDKNVKIKAFPVVLRPNKGVHRVQRSILHKNDLSGALGDVSISSKRRLEVRQNFVFFIANLAIFEYRPALNGLT